MVLQTIGTYLGKAWLAITSGIGSLVLFLIGLSLLLGMATQAPTPVSQKVIEQGGLDKVAVINLSGPIVENVGSDALALSPEVIASRRVIRILDEVAEDDSVKAVILRINSPGGAVVPSDEIFRKVLEVREQKPVIASMGDLAASGGYYIAAGADTIIAHPATITGSIGVIAQFPQVSELFDKLGIEMRTYKSGQFKDIGSPTSQISQQEAAILESIITDAYELFIDAIVTGREMEEDRVRELADGRIYSGLQAKEAGLVDELGNLDYSIEYASSLAQVSDPTVVEYADQTFIEALLGARQSSSPLESLEKMMTGQSFGVYYLLSI